MAKVGLYLRVSTGEQTTENQRLELEAWAVRAGHEIVATYEDAGISGSKAHDQRPELDRALKDAVRRRYDILAAWAVDRLGRSMPDLVATLQELRSAGVDLFLHQQALDTSTPSGRAMYQMLGVFAEFERAMIVERVNAGLARARAKGVKLGRPTVDEAKIAHLRQLLTAGTGIRRAAQIVGVGTGTAQRVAHDIRSEIRAQDVDIFN